ncbi:MAG TPA: hypothetical protein ENK50_05275 [Sedimenticola sp.]|nr:hypothetical protein [Sedimenticola sp.]
MRYRPLLLGKGQRWYHVPSRRPQVTVEVRPPLDPVTEDLPLPRAARLLTRRLESLYAVWEQER